MSISGAPHGHGPQANRRDRLATEKHKQREIHSGVPGRS